MNASVPLAQKRLYTAVVMGNILDHYSTALYGFLAPVLAPLYFPDSDPVVQLMMAYGLLAMGLFSRPLGAVVLGRWAVRWGPRHVLCLALWGMACSTALMGAVPTHAQWGWAAPLSLAFLKMCQGFFASGERAVASIYAISLLPATRRALGSSLYQSATMLGILLASAGVAVLPWLQHWGLGWRFLFALGGASGLIMLWVRTHVSFDPHKPATAPYSLWKSLCAGPLVFVRTVLVAGFSYITYVVPFVFMNALGALLGVDRYVDLMAFSTALMAADMLLLPVLGWWADRQGHWAMMRWAAAVLGVLSMVLFPCLPHQGLWSVVLLNGSFVFFGLVFLVPLKVWLLDTLGPEDAYGLGGLAFAVGSEAIGKTLPMVALMLYAWTDHIMAPAAYIAMWCALTAWAVGTHPSRRS